MFDKDAIEALQHGAGIKQGNEAVTRITDSGAVALPNHFQLHDLEPYMMFRRRQRGHMATNSVASFAEYCKAHAEDGARVFIDSESMTAKAVLNLGNTDGPGHADNTASVTLTKTAAFEALLTHANGRGMTQTQMAEFLEDWPDLIECYKDSANVTNKQAIAAIRKLTVESMRKLENEEQALAASKTTFEAVKATSSDPIPTHIYFKCVPYAGLPERTFVLRFGVLTSGPTTVLRIVKREEHEEEMAEEFAQRVTDAIGDSIPVTIGKYSRAQ